MQAQTKKLKHLIDDLYMRLSEDVYTDDEKEVIDQTRVLLDLPSLASLLKQLGESVATVQV